MAEIWGAAIAVAGAVGGSYLSSQGAKKAANKAAAGTEAAIAEQRRQFDLIRGDTAPYRAIGNQALNALGSIYGYSPTYGQSGPTGNRMEYSGGGGKVNYLDAGRKLLGPKNAALGLISPSAQLFSSGKILGGLFGSKKGDEKRNLKAFTSENKVYDLGDGTLQLEDGTVLPASQLEELAGTWYGATYAPDGDQEGWQGRYQDVLSRIQSTPENANRVQAEQQAQAPQQPLSSPDYSAFFQSPDYNFRRDEGTRGIGNSFAARGGAASGNALKALAEFNSNLAAGEFGNYFNRQAALAGIGQTATGQSAQAGMFTGANVGNSLMMGANARASGVAGQYNALGAGMSGLAQGVGYWNANRGMNNNPLDAGWGSGANANNAWFGG
jgi:hypothetical protein